MSRVRLLCLAVGLILLSSGISYAKPVDRLIQIIDYVGVDYQKAVVDGKVASVSEYGEMVEFATTMEQLAGKLTTSAATVPLQAKVGQLKALIVAKAPADRVTALANIIRSSLIKSYNLATTPDRAPDLARGKQLYQQNCASCHGIEGYGNGPEAGKLEPKPINFHDRARYQQRSLYGLFSTVTYGVKGTAMTGFTAMTGRDRWDMTAYVGQLGANEKAVDRGKSIWQQIKHDSGRNSGNVSGNNSGNVSGAVSLQAFTTLSPNEAAQQWTGGKDLMAYLRRSPGVLFAASGSPIAYAGQKLQSSYQNYRDGHKQQAYADAVSAYLEGFELIEANLAAVDPVLMKQIEKAMAQYRNDLQQKLALPVITDHYQKLLPLLRQAKDQLSEQGSLTPVAAFIAGFIILLREGLEALLVIIALSAFLIKTDRRDAMPYLHFGWISALVLGVATWMVSERILQISGATREVTEGVSALTASATLLFVSYWLHNKTSAAGWQRFIQESVKSALNGQTLWGLAGLSFITVYREIFETILFYQALWTQADSHSANAVIAGFVAASLTLMAIAWLAIKYSVRLPLRQFFGGTGVF
ncbi:MAG: c-type cytochrome [Alphaproteobacteria bacterium]|nr:c-type cytochrome [Alphaproteobacteria bacterium]